MQLIVFVILLRKFQLEPLYSYVSGTPTSLMHNWHLQTTTMDDGAASLVPL